MILTRQSRARFLLLLLLIVVCLLRPQLALGLSSLLFKELSENQSSSSFFRFLISSRDAFISVDSDPMLDPGESDSCFIVSFDFSYRTLPPVGVRQKLIAKYDKDHQPYDGWAIAFNRRKTSLRPEIYLRSTDGRGGWFVFDDVVLSPGAVYSLTLFVSRREGISLFIQHRGTEDVLRAKIGSSELQGLKPSFDGNAIFLGGHRIADIEAVQTTAPLRFGAFVEERVPFLGSIGNVLIAQARGARLPAMSELTSVKNARETFTATLTPEQIELLVSTTAEDSSPRSRALKLSGNARWQHLH